MFEEDDSDRQVRYVNAYEGWGEGRTPTQKHDTCLPVCPSPPPSPRSIVCIKTSSERAVMLL